MVIIYITAVAASPSSPLFFSLLCWKFKHCILYFSRPDITVLANWMQNTQLVKYNYFSVRSAGHCRVSFLPFLVRTLKKAKTKPGMIQTSAIVFVVDWQWGFHFSALFGIGRLTDGGQNQTRTVVRLNSKRGCCG